MRVVSSLLAVAAFAGTAIFVANLAAAPLAASPKVSQAKTAIDPTGTWKIDTSHSLIGFSVAHMGVSKTRGKFNEFSGTVVANPKNLAQSSVSFTIAAKSVDTANSARDGHLRGADFFDVEKFPEISFKSVKVEKAGRGYRATGDLTMHGVTKRVSFPFTITGPIKGMQNEARAGVQAKLSVNRKDYGLTWNRLVEGTSAVGEIVEIDIDLEATK